MSKQQITVVGGGSVSWMAIFMKDIVASESMEGGTVVLQDLSLPALQKMRQFSEKLIAERKRDIEVVIEQDLRKAVTGSTFVLNTVLVGSHDAWTKEQNIIKAHGIQHPKGMSVGPGGMMMGIKQIPFVLDLARTMVEVCPDAWLFNFSNPMQLLMLSIQRFVPELKSVGICHGVKDTIEIISQRMGVNDKDLSFVAGGVNHFEIIKSITMNGKDMFPTYLEKLEEMDRKDGVKRFYFAAPGQPHDHHLIKVEAMSEEDYQSLPLEGEAKAPPAPALEPTPPAGVEPDIEDEDLDKDVHGEGAEGEAEDHSDPLDAPDEGEPAHAADKF